MIMELSKLLQPIQVVQLKHFLSPEMKWMLLHQVNVPLDSLLSTEDVLQHIHKHS